MKHFKNEFKCFPKERHEAHAYSTTKKWAVGSLFVAMALLSPVGENLQDIWESPGRLTTIEADIVDINEMIRFIEDENRIITSVNP